MYTLLLSYSLTRDFGGTGFVACLCCIDPTPHSLTLLIIHPQKIHQTPELEAWSGYTEEEALGMARRIARLAQEPLPLVGTRRLTALTRKYASSRFREVAAMTCLPLP